MAPRSAAKQPAIEPRMQVELEQTLAVFARARVIAAKPLRRRLDEIAFYPAHDERKKSSGYKAVHKRLVMTLDLPCAVCGVKRSTLRKPRENRYGAKAMETHHNVIEWSLGRRHTGHRRTHPRHICFRHHHARSFRVRTYVQRTSAQITTGTGEHVRSITVRTICWSCATCTIGRSTSGSTRSRIRCGRRRSC